MESFIIKKILNNNVVIATHSTYHEVVLIGKGIGFGKNQGDEITQNMAEKIFVLRNEREQEQYKVLLTSLDESFIEVMNDIIDHIRKRVHDQLNEHIHIALTDHLAFAIKRLEQGLDLSNPFLIETKTLYPLEYEVAEEVVEILREKTGIQLPIGEVGFIALHIHSALSNRTLSEVNKHSQLISELLSLIESELNFTINREGVNYLRLIRHLRYVIDRVVNGEEVEETESLAKVLKKEYPVCYNLSWKVIKTMQEALTMKVSDAEAVYLTVHLQRIASKNE